MADKRSFETDSGVELPPYFSEKDSVDPGLPGQFPFVRGVQENMYRGRLWTMRQYAGFGSAAETNKRFHGLLASGQTGLSVAFDLPTQIGLDSDDRLALGEVGRVGVAIDTLADMETLLAGIRLDTVSTSMTINATAPVLLAMYIAVARKQGVAPGTISGTIQNDILKEYIARGTYIYPASFSLRLITDVFEYCRDSVPNWNTISISGYHIREAGSTAVQELAFTFGDAIAYLQAAIDRGLRVDDIAPRISFFFNVHNDFLEEIAKFRAARRIWSGLMRDRFAATNPKSRALRFHAQTAGSSLTAKQPDVNIVRVTLQAMAAVLGGAQSLHTNSMDEALALPTFESARLALRTQQIIAHESGVVNTVDPCGGSYAIEALTSRLEAETHRYLQKIDSLGGMLAVIESGWVQREIQDAAYRYQRSIETGDRVVVGVNKFVSETETPIPLLRIDPEIERAQVDSLRRVRSTRDAARVQRVISALRDAAGTDANLMPLILEAVEAYASIGEICGAFRAVHGEYRESVAL